MMMPTTGMSPLMYHGQHLTLRRLVDLAPVNPFLRHLARLLAVNHVASGPALRMLTCACGASSHDFVTTECIALAALVNDTVSKTCVRDETGCSCPAFLDCRHIATS